MRKIEEKPQTKQVKIFQVTTSNSPISKDFRHCKSSSPFSMDHPFIPSSPLSRGRKEIIPSPVSSPLSLSKSSSMLRPTAIVIPQIDTSAFYPYSSSTNYSGYTGNQGGRGGQETHDLDCEMSESMQRFDDSDDEDHEYLEVLPTFVTPCASEDLVFSSNLKIPHIVIPGDRITTPRTPKTPTKQQRKHFTPRSPVDDILLLSHSYTSPSEVMKNKYKVQSSSFSTLNSSVYSKFQV
jgi:hypothetical protein